jgi:hypothetical protein
MSLSQCMSRCCVSCCPFDAVSIVQTIPYSIYFHFHTTPFCQDYFIGKGLPSLDMQIRHIDVIKASDLLLELFRRLKY